MVSGQESGVRGFGRGIETSHSGQRSAVSGQRSTVSGQGVGSRRYIAVIGQGFRGSGVQGFRCQESGV